MAARDEIILVCSKELHPTQIFRPNIYACNHLDGSELCTEPLLPRYNPSGKSLRERIQSGPNNFFRYADLMPVSAPKNYGEGFTELVFEDELAKAIGLEKGDLALKYDHKSSGSFKFRGADTVARFVEESNEQEADIRALACSSTGNLAGAVAKAAYGIGKSSIVIVHKGADKTLIDRALSQGAYVIRSEGDYYRINSMLNSILMKGDELSEALLNRIAWVNITYRPVYSQGSKTIGFEIAEQLGWRAPDNVVHPVAAGLSLWQIYQGLKEAYQFGLISSLDTRMHAVQPKGKDPERPADALVTAFLNGTYDIEQFQEPHSIAETLCVGYPSNGKQVLDVLNKSSGSAVSVTEQEIKDGMELVYETTGRKVGPVGGAVISGLKRQVNAGIINPNQLTVAVQTDSDHHSSDMISQNVSQGQLIEVNSGNGFSLPQSMRTALETLVQNL